MDTKLLLKAQEQSIAQDQNSLALIKLKKRRLDTRTKIEYGGLVIKSTLNKYNKDIILGALIYINNLIEQDNSKKDFFDSIGKSNLYKV